MKKSLVICAAAICIMGVLLAVWPLFGKKYIPTHDGEYHIIRIVEFSRMLGAGYIFPRWAPDLNSGYGIPIFNYHYPLPNYIGSFVRVFTGDAVYAFQMSMGLGYIALAAALFFWLLTLFGAIPAVVGTTVAAFVPYLFVDVYVRGSIGEVWATAFLILCFYLLEKKKLFWFAFAYGLLILSHNIMAMLYTPFLFGYALIRNKKGVVWMLGGIGFSAFFWLPALIESKYVVGLNTINFREHFVQMYELLIPSWGTGFSGTGAFGESISFQLGIAPIIAILAAAWIVWREKEKNIRQLTLYLFFVLTLSIVFMFRLSQPLWEIMKPLQLIQYPWRLLSFLVPVAAYAAAYWVSRMKRQWLGIVFAVFAVMVAYSYARPVLYAPRSEAYYMSRPNFTDGTSSMGNSFSTIWTGWKDTRAESPLTIPGGTISATLRSDYLDRKYDIQTASPTTVTVNTTYFPGWKAYVDDHNVPIAYPAGIINVHIPQGLHTLEVRFGETPTRIIGDSISVLSLVILGAYAILAL